jgi:starch synthase (maltosyl-transferring)
MSGQARQDGRVRVEIERVTPEVDGGRFAVKRSIGERVIVEADAFCDGHDRIRCVLQYRRAGQQSTPGERCEWDEVPMVPLVNDRWRGVFQVTALGGYEYTVCAWVDHFLSWRHDLTRRVDAQDIELALEIGADIVQSAGGRASGTEARQLLQWAIELRDRQASQDDRCALGTSDALDAMMFRHGDRSLARRHARVLPVWVDVERARFSAWYELFPRSCIEHPGEHGTFKSCEARLHYIAEMGFDVLYLPPIFPIGRSQRKGPNNTLVPAPDDPGSPWAIGASEGGHKTVHPGLGTLEDFRQLVQSASDHGLAVALDIAFQCSPDHPYVAEHPQWFRWRPDGSVQYAENPPKKYQDIYPFNFETDDWPALWDELKSVFLFWIEQGVRIFRVDNPHTKPFVFWQWVIAEVRQQHPDVIFLSEAFTRPRVMHRLAKLGFTQSYTYFTWRNTKYELTEYGKELFQSPSREYFRPNLWPNTPDILPEYLQYGGRPAFIARLILAATMGASYGIYGPAFELAEHQPRDPGSEEYRDSEKYQIRHWDLKRRDSLRNLIARVNAIRRENPALQYDWELKFHDIDNEMMIAYSKSTPDMESTIVVVVNLDPHHRQSGWLDLPADDFELPQAAPFQMHDLLSGARFLWQSGANYVELDPQQSPAHVFRLRRRTRTERDFDYFM